MSSSGRGGSGRRRGPAGDPLLDPRGGTATSDVLPHRQAAGRRGEALRQAVKAGAATVLNSDGHEEPSLPPGGGGDRRLDRVLYTDFGDGSGLLKAYPDRPRPA